MENRNNVRKMLKELTTVSLLTAFFVISAYIHIPMSVPVTLQTFALSLCLSSAGALRTLKVLTVYVAAGCVGLPVFSSFRGGISVLLEPSGGYIAGFYLSVLLYMLLNSIVCSFKFKKHILTVISLIPMYLTAALWYNFVYLPKDVSGFGTALLVCCVPFIIPDIVKAVLGVEAGKRLERFIK